jgi:DNA polymerase-3 subunit beta
MSLRYAVTQVEVEKTGDTLVTAETLSRIVRECDDELLTAEVKGSQFHIDGKGTHFQIVTQAVDEFPAVPTLEGEPDLAVGQAELARLIEWTVFACARESSRYAISGVLWEVDGEKLTLVATDGRRLSLASGKADSTGEGAVPSAIVPGRALSLFARLSHEPDAKVLVKISSNQLLLQVGGALIGTALVEGHFPKYQDVIPQDCNREVVLNTAEFQTALKQAALLTNEESKGVRLRFADGSLTISSRAPEQGEATVSMPVKYTDTTTEIGFNPVCLLDVLRVVQEDELVFAFKEPNRPGVVRAGSNFLYVVMPVNLGSA